MPEELAHLISFMTLWFTLQKQVGSSNETPYSERMFLVLSFPSALIKYWEKMVSTYMRFDLFMGFGWSDTSRCWN